MGLIDAWNSTITTSRRQSREARKSVTKKKCEHEPKTGAGLTETRRPSMSFSVASQSARAGGERRRDWQRSFVARISAELAENDYLGQKWKNTDLFDQLIEQKWPKRKHEEKPMIFKF